MKQVRNASRRPHNVARRIGDAYYEQLLAEGVIPSPVMVHEAGNRATLQHDPRPTQPLDLYLAKILRT